MCGDGSEKSNRNWIGFESVDWMGSEFVKDGMPGSTSISTANSITDPFVVVNDHLSGTAANKYVHTENNDINSTHSTASEVESKHSLPSGLKQNSSADFGP